MEPPKIEVNFDQDALHDLISKWVLEQMSVEQREKVLQQAITYLMTPPKADKYATYQPPSPLQEAFNNALNRVMHDVARTIVDEDPAIRDAIQKLMGEALEEFLHGAEGDKKRGYVQKMGEAFSYLFYKGPYD